MGGIMKLDDLLMDDDQAKWYILQYLGMRRNNFISVDLLCTFFQLSKYKIEKYLEDLITDTITLTGKQVIFLSPDGEVQCSELTPLLLKQFTGKFFLQSEIFRLFHRILIKEDRIENQMADFGLSRSTAFKIRRRLKEDINREGFDLKKNCFSGDEFRLRSFLFGLYYEAFNGIENPFPADIQQLGKKIIQQLVHHQQITLKKTQEHKLIFFLDIWLIRLRHGHGLKQVYGSLTDASQGDFLRPLLQGHCQLRPELLQRELDYLFLYLELEGITDTGQITYHACDEADKAEYLTQQFLSYFTDFLGLEMQELMTNLRAQSDLLNIHRRLLFYHFREVTFINDAQTKFFEEVNPMIDTHINVLLDRVALLEVLDNREERNKLYHDYLFYLLYWIPAQKFEQPLHVCIDFSHGKYYNRYVEEMLNSMQSLNICFEEKLSAKTSVYLTDFAIEKLPCKQVIWKRPPTPDDWRELGDVLIKTKEEDKADEKNRRECDSAVVADQFTTASNFESVNCQTEG